MRQKLQLSPDLQLLVNSVMPWAEAQLQETGRIPAATAWLRSGHAEPEFRTGEQTEGSARQSSMARSVAEQEAMLVTDLRGAWQRGELAAVLLAAPVFYGRTGSAQRSPAVRLHVEARDGYCADIFMPYRIRAGSRWRGNARNRVHFTHPVAQESDSRFSDSPALL
ncbi:MAG: hypothetical protein QOK38_3454 [Acidobacteriaceae bacterium]|jgi:hypothetical protein|nr:hypothetical protein [Acidobacteriaceae bacterium]